MMNKEAYIKVKRERDEAIGCLRHIRSLSIDKKTQSSAERIAARFLKDRGIE